MLDVRFVWVTPALGHEWKSGKAGWRLVPLSGGPARHGVNRFVVAQPGGAHKLTPPPGLFRTFARLENGRAEIQAFADEYGDIVAQPADDRVGDRIIRNHAREDVWHHAIRQMRGAVGLWDRIKDDSDHGGARRELRRQIRRALRDPEATPGRAMPDLTPDMRLVIGPENLLAYMWLTFARVVSGEIEERPCPGQSKSCLGYIYIGKGQGLRRNDPTATCSDACRKAMKRRKA